MHPHIFLSSVPLKRKLVGEMQYVVTTVVLSAQDHGSSTRHLLFFCLSYQLRRLADKTETNCSKTLSSAFSLVVYRPLTGTPLVPLVEGLPATAPA
jgi:hypothetical protein